MPEQRRWIVLLPGSRWSDIAGTDRQLAEALARVHDVVWVDPPFPVVTRSGLSARERGLREVAPGIFRLQPWTLPASSRSLVRSMAGPLQRWQLDRQLRRNAITPIATVGLSPRSELPKRSGGRRVLFVTDDWVAGADLMGLDRSWVVRRLRSNVCRADRVVAITEDLARELRGVGARSVAVIPNGATLHDPGDGPREPLAGLVGQLNERLDTEILRQVAGRGVQLLVVGPLAARDAEATRRLRDLLALPNVTWVGPVPHTDLPEHLSRMSVGMTPYVTSDFNRSSYPLKTLEYLGAGLPVVSTDLPAARELKSGDVHIATNPEDFAKAVERLVHADPDAAAEVRRRAFGRRHSWDARVRQLLELLEQTE